jgi:hypothetical protein
MIGFVAFFSNPSNRFKIRKQIKRKSWKVGKVQNKD